MILQKQKTKHDKQVRSFILVDDISCRQKTSNIGANNTRIKCLQNISAKYEC